MYLMLAMPLDAQDLQKATGVPVLISDGQRAVSVAGSAAQQSTLSALVGKEAEGRAQGPDAAWLALAAPVGPKLWLWVLHPSTTAASSDVIPVLLGVLAVLLGAGAFFLRRGRGAAQQPDQSAQPGSPSTGRG
jgi:hypothetical protein